MKTLDSSSDIVLIQLSSILWRKVQHLDKLCNASTVKFAQLLRLFSELMSLHLQKTSSQQESAGHEMVHVHEMTWREQQRAGAHILIIVVVIVVRVGLGDSDIRFELRAVQQRRHDDAQIGQEFLS